MNRLYCKNCNSPLPMNNKGKYCCESCKVEYKEKTKEKLKNIGKKVLICTVILAIAFLVFVGLKKVADKFSDWVNSRKDLKMKKPVMSSPVTVQKNSSIKSLTGQEGMPGIENVQETTNSIMLMKERSEIDIVNKSDFVSPKAYNINQHINSLKDFFKRRGYMDNEGNITEAGKPYVCKKPSTEKGEYYAISPICADEYKEDLEARRPDCVKEYLEKHSH